MGTESPDSESVFDVKFPVDRMVDASGLRCPLPLLRAKQAVNQLQSQQVLLLIATDVGADRDIPAWIQLSGHQLLLHSTNDAVREFYIRKK